VNTTEQQAVARTVVNRIAAARGLQPPWPDSDAVLPDWLAGQDLSGWGVAELGDLRERLATDDERKAGGIWYTPPALADDLTRFSLQIDSCAAGCVLPGCAMGVLVLDPSCGAGVVLLSAAREIARRYAALVTGAQDPPAWMVRTVLPYVMSVCVFGIDIDPVAVDLARAVCWLEIDGTRPIGFLDDNIACGDPLAGELPKGLEQRLSGPDPLLIVGNPPYGEHAKGQAPWIEARRGGGEELFPRPSMDEFRVAGNGRFEHKLSNLWTFFWRWASWRALESREAPGTVAFITPSAYLGSKAHAGMRAHMRRVASEGWLIDLSPEGKQAPVKTRLFPTVQTPLMIGLFTTHQRAGVEQGVAS
jgi:hypothetical protein